jgi:hypothetical protein
MEMESPITRILGKPATSSMGVMGPTRAGFFAFWAKIVPPAKQASRERVSNFFITAVRLI